MVIVCDVLFVDFGEICFDGCIIYIVIDLSCWIGLDFIFDNVDGGDGSLVVLFVGVSKEWDNGFDMVVLYVYVDVEDVNLMISFVVFFNYINFVISDLNNFVVVIFDYVVGNCFNFLIGYIVEFFDGYVICFNLFVIVNEGKFFFYVYSNNDVFGWDVVDVC